MFRASASALLLLCFLVLAGTLQASAEASDDAPGIWVWKPLLCNRQTDSDPRDWSKWWACAKAGTQNDFDEACAIFVARKAIVHFPHPERIVDPTPGYIGTPELAGLCNKSKACKTLRDDYTTHFKDDIPELTCDSH